MHSISTATSGGYNAQPRARPSPKWLVPLIVSRRPDRRWIPLSTRARGTRRGCASCEGKISSGHRTGSRMEHVRTRRHASRHSRGLRKTPTRRKRAHSNSIRAPIPAVARQGDRRTKLFDVVRAFEVSDSLHTQGSCPEAVEQRARRVVATPRCVRVGPGTYAIKAAPPLSGGRELLPAISLT